MKTNFFFRFVSKETQQQHQQTIPCAAPSAGWKTGKFLWVHLHYRIFGQLLCTVIIFRIITDARRWRGRDLWKSAFEIEFGRLPFHCHMWCEIPSFILGCSRSLHTIFFWRWGGLHITSLAPVHPHTHSLTLTQRGPCANIGHKAISISHRTHTANQKKKCFLTSNMRCVGSNFHRSVAIRATCARIPVYRIY